MRAIFLHLFVVALLVAFVSIRERQVQEFMLSQQEADPAVITVEDYASLHNCRFGPVAIYVQGTQARISHNVIEGNWRIVISGTATDTRIDGNVIISPPLREEKK